MLGGLPILADQVALKNGDRLTGAVVKFDGKNLVFKSEYAGQLSVPWEVVTALTTDAPVLVGLKNGQTLAGAISLADQSLRVESKEAGRITAARDSIEYIRSKAEQAAYELEMEKYRNPRLVDLWTGFVDLGISESRGNAQTSTITTSANATRTTKRDKIGVHFASLLASNSTAGPSVVTANAMRGGVNYSLNLAPRVSAFGLTELEFDEFQSLDLRFAPAGGLGYSWIKDGRTTLDVMGGAALNREFFSTGLRRTSGEATLGQELIHKLSERTSIREKFTLLPNLTYRGQYRMNFDASAVTAIRRWIGWQLTFSDRFLSNPVAGRKRNGVLFTTGVRLTFAR